MRDVRQTHPGSRYGARRSEPQAQATGRPYAAPGRRAETRIGPALALGVRIGRSARRGGFTLVELLVASAILSILIVGIGFVFKSAGDAAGITEADTNLLERWRVFDTAVRSDLGNHLSTPDGLLIIHSELVNSTGEADLGGAILDGVPRLARVDRIAFTAAGHYESAIGVAERSVSAGLLEPVTSDAALVYYGHGHPGVIVPPIIPTSMITPDPPGGFTVLPRTAWTLCRRAILLGAPNPTSTSPVVDYPGYASAVLPSVGFATLGNVPSAFEENVLDAGVTSLRDLIDFTSLGSGVPAYAPTNPGSNQQYGYYYRPKFPRSATAASFRRAFPIMLDGIGDFIVEWTDGSVVDPTPTAANDPQPVDMRIQWFGMPRDANGDGQRGVLRSGDTVTKVDWLNAVDPQGLMGLTDTFKVIENYNGTTYHAAWFSNRKPDSTVNNNNPRGDFDDRFRPKAFRIVMRVYDPTLRIESPLRDRVNTVDPYNGSALPTGTDRWGREVAVIAP